MKRLIGSTTLCLLLVLLLVELGCRLPQISLKQGGTGVIDDNPIVSTIKATLRDPRQNPDVLIVGSSLVHCFTYAVDGPDDATSPEEIARPACGADKFMSDQLKQLLGKELNIQVMSFPGAMVTDVCGIVEAAYSNGKTTPTIVYLTAPRDFVDRLVAPNSFSLFAEPAKKQGPQTTGEQFKSWVSANLPPSVLRRLGLLADKPTAALACEIALDCCSKVYEQRSQLRNNVTEAACAFFDRDRDLWSAAHSERKTLKKMTHFDHDLANYSSRYNPPDFSRIHTEARMLSKLAKVCQDNNARLVVVNMPLTAENKKLLDPKLYAEYKSTLAKLNNHPSVRLIDCDGWTFNRPEFLDSAHLNIRGSRKLQQLLAPELAAKLAGQRLEIADRRQPPAI